MTAKTLNDRNGFEKMLDNSLTIINRHLTTKEDKRIEVATKGVSLYIQNMNAETRRLELDRKIGKK